MIIYIPGWLSTFLTFPGVIMHEISHRLMCDILGVPVYEIAYFNFGSKRAGYVLHGKPKDIFDSLLIAIAPLFINSLICLLFTFPHCAWMRITGALIPHITADFITAYNMILFWIGLSAIVHAKPSDQDMESILATHQFDFDAEPPIDIIRIMRVVRCISFFRFLIIGFIMILFLGVLFD